MRRSGATAAICEKYFLASIYGNKHSSNAPIASVPGNRRFARLFAGGNRVRVGTQKRRLFFQQAKRALVSFGICWSRARCIANRNIREEIPSCALDQSLQPVL